MTYVVQIRYWEDAWSNIYLMAFTNVSSLHSKLRTLGNPVVDVAIVDVLLYVYTYPPLYDMTSLCIRTMYGVYTYWRGLRSCLSLQGGQVRRPGV